MKQGHHKYGTVVLTKKQHIKTVGMQTAFQWFSVLSFRQVTQFEENYLWPTINMIIFHKQVFFYYV